VSKQPWKEPMPEEQFALMRRILGAPSPVGLEGAMTRGVLYPYFESFMPPGWAIHEYRGNAGLVLDSHPARDDLFKVMIIGHADKIRLQVRSIGDDGKLWLDSDSFLPATLIGHEVVLFSESPEQPGTWRRLEGGTIEAIGAIHFAAADLRTGRQGIKPESLYLELQIYGEKKREQIEKLGVRPGDPLILDRPIRRGFSPDTYYGAYLDNGLGCFVAAEVARLVAERKSAQTLRLLTAIATHEEIGRMGSRVLAAAFKPDVVIGVDVSHDYVAAPGVKDKRFSPVTMGKGFTLAYGSITNAFLNSLIETVARASGIPCQPKVVGRDTGTDAMAGVFASIDAAATSIGFPIRNMHTISETGHTGDALAAIHVLADLIEHMQAMNDGDGISADDFKTGHPRLDEAGPLTHVNGRE
jgi:putative aminopeptidase FrvX